MPEGRLQRTRDNYPDGVPQFCSPFYYGKNRVYLRFERDVPTTPYVIGDPHGHCPGGGMCVWCTKPAAAPSALTGLTRRQAEDIMATLSDLCTQRRKASEAARARDSQMDLVHYAMADAYAEAYQMLKAATDPQP